MFFKTDTYTHTLTRGQWFIYSLVATDVMANRWQGVNRLVAIDLFCGTWIKTHKQAHKKLEHQNEYKKSKKVNFL